MYFGDKSKRKKKGKISVAVLLEGCNKSNLLTQNNLT